MVKSNEFAVDLFKSDRLREGTLQNPEFCIIPGDFETDIRQKNGSEKPSGNRYILFLNNRLVKKIHSIYYCENRILVHHNY